MIPCKLNVLKSTGEKFFKLNPESKQVYSISHYNKQDKTYSCFNVEDHNTKKFIKADKIVYIGFTY